MLSNSTRGFLRASILYFLLAVCFGLVTRGGDIGDISASGFGFGQVMAILATNRILVMLILALAVAAYAFGGGRGREILVEAGVALAATAVFLAAFNIVKCSLPHTVPFFADPMFTALDRVLHLGHTPWEITHALGDVIDPDLASLYYVNIWMISAFGFPALMFFLDRDDARRRRYLILYGFVWIGLGNVLALAFMSAGPIYYERVIGDPAFRGLADALVASGVEASLTGFLQDYLWEAYSLQQSRVGSGISAFPSVHVGMAALLALYLAERHPVLGIVGGLHLVSTLFLSVHLGWHYAVDGYFAIAAVAIAGALLRRHGSRAGDARTGTQGRMPGLSSR